jgi:hypothetical protein
MRTWLIALTAISTVAGCGDDTSTMVHPDLSAHGVQDMTVSPDQSMPTATACGAIYDCVFNQGMSPATCLGASPPAAQALFMKFTQCFSSACGIGANTDAGANAACKQDGGVTSDTCTTCVDNTTSGPNGPFVDNQGNPIPCKPTNAPECGVCANQISDCLQQCFNDADCAGFVNPLHCVNNVCM